MEHARDSVFVAKTSNERLTGDDISFYLFFPTHFFSILFLFFRVLFGHSNHRCGEKEKEKWKRERERGEIVSCRDYYAIYLKSRAKMSNRD